MQTFRPVQKTLPRIASLTLALVFTVLACLAVVNPPLTHAEGNGVLKLKVIPKGVPASVANTLVRVNSGGATFSDCGGLTSNNNGSVFPVAATSETVCNGVNVYIPYTRNGPSGTYITKEGIVSPKFNYNWTILSDSTGGSSKCFGYGCMMNFNKGTLELGIEISPRDSILKVSPDLSNILPRLSATAVTDNSVKLGWTFGVNSSGVTQQDNYWLYMNDGTHALKTGWSGLQLPSGGSSYEMTGLSPCMVYQFALTMSGDFSNIQTVRTTGCAAPTPTASSGSSGGTSQSGRNSFGSSGSSNGGAYDWGGDTYYDVITGNGTVDVDDGLINEDQADPSKPPAMPGFFRAVGTKGNSAVSLGWATSYGKSKVHYKLERSGDKQKWTVLRDNITSNAFNDFTAEFGALYYYRLTAIDEHNLYSPSVVVSYNADNFNPNVGNGKKLQLTSKDKFLRFAIPSSAVSMASNCFFAEATPGLPLVGGKDQKVIGGPYKLVCQQEDGSIAGTFNKPVTVTAELSDTTAKQYSKVRFEAYSATTHSWQPVAAAETNSRSITFDSDDMTLVALAEPRGTPVWATILLVVLLGGALAISGALGIRSGVRLLDRRKAAAADEDYWHKMNGV